MNNQYTQYPQKWSLKPPESISAFRSLVGNTKRVFQCNVLAWRTNFVWLTGTILQKTTYPAVINSSRLSTKVSICTCRDVGVEIPSDFPTSGLNNCLGKVVKIATKRLSVRWRKSATEIASGVTRQLRDKWCWFSRQKELSVGSIEVLLWAKRLSNEAKRSS